MRKAAASAFVSLALLGGITAPAVAQTGGDTEQTTTTNENDDSGKLGLLGLTGLLGLAGLARRDRERDRDRASTSYRQ
jgi:MYXO-CTERM domain-containing protein